MERSQGLLASVDAATGEEGAGCDKVSKNRLRLVAETPTEVVATRVKDVSNNTQPEDKKKAKVAVKELQTSSVNAGAMCPALKQPSIVFSGSISYSIALIEDRIISEDNEGTILDGKAIKSVPNQSGTQEGPGKRHLSQDQTLQSGNASCRREEQHGPMIDL